jgi:hypothetical protein
MKNFINFVQIWMKYVSMEGKCYGFLLGRNVVTSQRPLGLLRVWASTVARRRWSGVAQRQQVRHIFWSFLLWSIAFIHSLLSSCLLITLQLVSKCYWLCFEWHFEWFRIGIIDWNQLNEKMDVWNVCFSHSHFCNAIVFRALFDTCTVYI